MTVEEQLIDLEIRLTQQAELIATLDEVVREFAARVERLERHAGGGAPGQGTIRSDDEPPPHY